MSDESIAKAIRDYLDVLEDLTDGRSHEYFGALYNHRPGSWQSTIRNIRYGLHHFPPGLVVDMGCGDGLQAYAFAVHGREVLGIDLQEERIQLATAAAQKLGVQMEFRAADATESLKGLKAGAIWMHRAIGHIKYLPEYLRLAHLALEPNGALVFMTSNAASRALIPGVRRGQYSVKRLRQLLDDAKFDVEDLKYHGYLAGLPEKYIPKNVDRIEPALSKIPVLRAMGGSFSMAAYVR